MAMRERMLAVLRGEKPDRVPFVQYHNVSAPDKEVWAKIGRENMGVLWWIALHRIEHPNCRRRTEEIAERGLRGLRTVIETPKGCMVEERFYEPALNTSSIRDHFVRQPDDYAALQAYLEDGVVVEDLAAFHEACEALGDDGLTLIRLERTPFQQLWVQWASIADLALHLVDCPDRVARCVDAMVRQMREVFEIAARTPVPFVDFPDNITAPVIGEAKFRKYCVPLYNELADMLAERGVPVLVHMDGDLRPLWDAIGECRINGIDSLSPPPDNDTSVADALSLWPDRCVLVNFPSSVHLATPREIYDRAGELLQQGGRTGRLQIQISENTPPGVWRKSYPEIVRAIRDFGPP